ncbi:MAG: hypothetical protein FJ291_16990, partial [Planctomycetes bacterium]|nr:hypothetical protein [Planctomycetota bacterium]
MARPRRRIRFQPFRMGEKFRNTILVGLGVFLMAIFAVPFQGSCERQRGPGGRSPNDVMLTFDGTRVRYGEVWEMRRLCQQVLRLQLTDEGAAMRIASLLEAERAGLRVTDDEVLDEIHNRLFSRHLRVEHVIARSSAFAKDIPVSDKELDDAYAAGKDKRFRRADKSYQPLSEVRESLLAELRERQAGPKAKAALEALRKQVAAIAGAPLENALKQLARPPELEFGEAQIPDNRSAAGALRAIGDAPGIAERVYRQRIGELSEPLPVAGGWCVFRVVARTRGFGPDGDFYPEEEGWVRQGYGTINVKAYGEVLAELGVTRAEVESTIRQELTLVVPISLLVNSVGELPKPMVKARYVRDNTQAVPAYFALWAADFAHGVSYTEADLRDFYGRHKAAPRVGATPGYRQPERVSIEFVLGRTSAIEAKLPEAELERYYQRNSAFFGPSFKDSREAVRKRLADEKLQTAIKRASDRAADEAATGVHSDLLAVIGQEAAGFADAFQVRTTPTFASDEAERLVPELRGAKLAETLFGDRGRQYAVVGAEPKEGAPAGTRISEILACDAGRFFFRVAERQPSHEIPFEDLPAGLREQLIDDVKNDKALALAKAKAKEYRTRVYQAAFDRFAERLGVKPLETDLPKAGDPLPAVGQPVPALHGQLAGGEVGDLSDVIAAGANFVLGRLVAREEAKPNRIQIATFGKENLKLAWEPALYEVRAAYDAAPFEFLDKPKPVPFEKVKDDIAKLLARRQALKTASERTKAALAELAGVKQPDIAAAAAKHNLQLRKDVGVKLAQPEATPELGKAAGFRDAISALEPGEVSDVLASAEGRFILVMKSRDEKAGTATVDVAAALYEPLRKEAKIDDKEVKQYYDDNRDTAYVTDDEIKEATPWDGVSAAVRDRVRDKLKGEWAKKPLPDQLTALRDSLAIEAFRTVPTSTPLPTQRNVSLRVETIGPFPLSKPEEPLAKEPEALAAIKALKPGELTKPIATGRGALIALMADRRPGGLARAKVAAFSVADFLKDTPEPDAAAIERHFAANKPAFQLPATATVEFLFVDSAERQRTIRAGLTDDDCRRYFQERAENEYAGLTYEASEYRVRSDMARERATREARLAASDALEAVRKSQAPHAASFPAVAKKLKAAHGKSDPVELKEPMSLNVLGQVRGLADELNKLKPGELIPRVVETSQGQAVCRLLDRTQSREPKLDEVRDRVAQALKVQTAREK